MSADTAGRPARVLTPELEVAPELRVRASRKPQCDGCARADQCASLVNRQSPVKNFASRADNSTCQTHW